MKVWEDVLEFRQDLFLEAYLPLAYLRMKEDWNDEDLEFQHYQPG